MTKYVFVAVSADESPIAETISPRSLSSLVRPFLSPSRAINHRSRSDRSRLEALIILDVPGALRDSSRTRDAISTAAPNFAPKLRSDRPWTRELVSRAARERIVRT